MSTNPVTRDRAAAELEHAASIRKRVRAQRRSVWFPLVVFGGLVMGSAATCANQPVPSGGGLGLHFVGVVSTDPNTLYWLIAAPLGYLAVYGYSRWRERRQGIGEEVRPYIAAGITLALLTAGVFLLLLSPESSGAVVAVGIGVAVIAWMLRRPVVAAFAGLLAALALVNVVIPFLIYGQALEANTAPVIGMAIALLVLAWLERSIFLGAVALVAGVASGLSGLFIIDNRFHILPHCGYDLSGIGGFMVACGVGAAVAEWVRRAR